MKKIRVSTKSEQIVNALRHEILSGKFLPGAEFHSQNELARSFGVSPHTVREAVSALVQDGLLVRLHGKGTFIAERNGFFNSGTVGLVINRCEIFDSSFFMEVNQGCHIALEGTDYHNVLIPFDAKDLQTGKNNFLSSIAQNKKIEGFIVAASEIPREELFSLQQKNIPFILANCFYPDENFNFVCPDFFRVSYLLTEYLLQMGHRQIVYFGGGGDFFIERERLRGYSEALENNGVKYNPALRIDWPFCRRNEIHVALKKLLQVLQKRSPTAVYCGDDLMAFRVIDEIRKKGYEVPGDISVAGVGNFRSSPYYYPPLTTVECQKSNMGEQATKELLRNIAGGRKTECKNFLEPSLVIRGSCAEKNVKKLPVKVCV